MLICYANVISNKHIQSYAPKNLWKVDD